MADWVDRIREEMTEWEQSAEPMPDWSNKVCPLLREVDALREQLRAATSPTMTDLMVPPESIEIIGDTSLREQLREARPALLRAVRRLDEAAHDVEGNLGCDASDLLFTDEEIQGYRSAYRADSNTLRALAETRDSDGTD